MSYDFRAVFERALRYQAFLVKYATPEQRQRWQQVYEQADIAAPQRTLLSKFRRKMYVLCLAGSWCGDCVAACPVFQRFAEAAPAGLIDLRFVNRLQRFDQAGDGTPPADDIRNTQFGKILVKWGILTAERVEKALLIQQQERSRGLNVLIGDVLTREGFITGEQRDRAVAAQHGYADYDAWDADLARELSICGAPRVPMLVFLSEDWHECERFGERTLATYRDRAAKLQGPSCSTGLFAPPADLLQANIAEWLTHFERVQLMLQTSPRLMKLHGEA